MPQQEREAVLRAASDRAEIEYRSNEELTAFEAFGREDLHGESSTSSTR
jgi:hypothetical protein